jgi:hypothetical protein
LSAVKPDFAMYRLSYPAWGNFKMKRWLLILRNITTLVSLRTTTIILALFFVTTALIQQSK